MNSALYGYNNTAPKALKKLGLRTALHIVEAVVSRLKDGESLYRIYGGVDGDGRLVSKRTAEKIQRLWRSGQLEFLDAPANADIRIADVTDAADIAGRYRAVSNAEHFSELIPEDDTPIARRVRAILPNLAVVTWSLRGLSAFGIPDEIALDLMADADALKAEILAKGWSFRRLVRAVRVHTLIEWYGEFENPDQLPPFPLLDRVADAFSKGLVNSNRPLVKAARDVVRYEVWRGKKNLEAYEKANRHPRGGTFIRDPLLSRSFRDVMDIIKLDGPWEAIQMELRGELHIKSDSKYQDNSDE